MSRLSNFLFFFKEPWTSRICLNSIKGNRLNALLNWKGIKHMIKCLPALWSQDDITSWKLCAEVKWAHQTYRVNSWNTTGWAKYQSAFLSQTEEATAQEMLTWSRRRAETSWGTNGLSFNISFRRELFVYLLLNNIFLTRDFPIGNLQGLVLSFTDDSADNHWDVAGRISPLTEDDNLRSLLSDLREGQCKARMTAL